MAASASRGGGVCTVPLRPLVASVQMEGVVANWRSRRTGDHSCSNLALVDRVLVLPRELVDCASGRFTGAFTATRVPSQLHALNRTTAATPELLTACELLFDCKLGCDQLGEASGVPDGALGGHDAKKWSILGDRVCEMAASAGGDCTLRADSRCRVSVESSLLWPRKLAISHAPNYCTLRVLLLGVLC